MKNMLGTVYFVFCRLTVDVSLLIPRIVVRLKIYLRILAIMIEDIDTSQKFELLLNIVRRFIDFDKAWGFNI